MDGNTSTQSLDPQSLSSLCNPSCTYLPRPLLPALLTSAPSLPPTIIHTGEERRPPSPHAHLHTSIVYMATRHSIFTTTTSIISISICIAFALLSVSIESSGFIIFHRVNSGALCIPSYLFRVTCFASSFAFFRCRLHRYC
ncbi:hypothetical protein JAAARDRAFT_246226 [Jaapia argillacea MUCL 33604]|uniref:Uncharacterized protein n=1 Tax=Jaapia argillacea MUCL 33604 TaxID=933084 RepID=A0A067QNA4_9AGAM|nr:hypothetical protein JAAARDRAFT_246226 [Jaapia argillacea MUCL 33604]